MNRSKKHNDEFIQSVIKYTEKMRDESPTRYWKRVVKKLQKEYPGKYITVQSVRWIYRRYATGMEELIQYKNQMIDNEQGLETLSERIMKRLKRKVDINWLSRYLGVSEDEVIVEIAKLQADGRNIRIWNEDGKMFAKGFQVAKEPTKDLSIYQEGVEEITIALVGDTHLGSEYSAEEELNNAYDIIEARGIKTVFHGGDLSEGWKSLRHETFLDNKAIGFQNQLDYVMETYPQREGINTYFIEGNHDLWVGKDALASFGKTLSQRKGRDDLHYLGAEYARIELTPKIDLTLFHPRDGSGANVFAKLQQFIDRGGDKVSLINFIYHYHKVGMIQHRGVYGFYGSSFFRKSNWMDMNNLTSNVGFWILTIKIGKNGDLIGLIPEYISYDEIKKPN